MSKIKGLLATLFAIGLLAANSPETWAQTRIPGAPIEVFDYAEVEAAALDFFGPEYKKGIKAVLARAFSELGAPDAYFMGAEDGGITEIGYRYGQGKLYHKGFGTKAVFWQGPSIGFDRVEPDTKVFVLVYNLLAYKSFYRRFESGETGYFFHAGVGSSIRSRLDMTLVQIRAGVEVGKGLNPAWVNFGEEKMVIPNVVRD